MFGGSPPGSQCQYQDDSGVPDQEGLGSHGHQSLGGRAGQGLVSPCEHWIPGPGPYVKSSPTSSKSGAALAIREQCSQNV